MNAMLVRAPSGCPFALFVTRGEPGTIVPGSEAWQLPAADGLRVVDLDVDDPPVREADEIDAIMRCLGSRLLGG